MRTNRRLFIPLLIDLLREDLRSIVREVVEQLLTEELPDAVRYLLAKESHHEPQAR
jgi:hypothetical protein